MASAKKTSTANRRRAPRVLLLYTGGTIGMDSPPGTLAPPKLSPARLSQRLRERVPELRELAQVEVEILANCDSAHLGPDDWLRFAARIEKRWNDFDGVVLLHGTDTMAYTASALSLLLRPCRKPVILTGAQRPLAAIRTDARRNLISSVEIAAHGPRNVVGQVCVFFDDHLFQGNRVRKRSAAEFAAFESPRAEPLARVGSAIEYSGSLLAAASTFPKLRPTFSRKVLMVHATPSAPLASFSRKLLSELEGICLVVYPSGTAPTRDPQFTTLLEQARRHHLPVVAVSEGIGAAPSPKGYEAGAALLKAGCHWAGALTPECAFVKASLILGQADGRTKFGQYWERNFAAEG